MKPISKLKIIALMLTLACTAPTFANTITPVTTTELNSTTTDAAKTEILLNRLNEIKDMDKSNLSRADKKALRAEVKVIKSEMKRSSNGVYLSIGAIIIIVLLLILIL